MTSNKIIEKREVREYFNGTGFERWNKIYSKSDEINTVQKNIRKGHQKTVDDVVTYIKNYPELTKKSYCDAGCGVGSLSIPLLRLGIKELQVSDISSEMIKETKKRINELALNQGKIKYEVCDLEKLKGLFDVVVCLDVFIHYPQPVAEEMVQHLCDLSNEKLIVSFAPYTPVLAVLKNIGKLFPKVGKDTTSAIVKTTTTKTTEGAVKTAGKFGFKGLLKKIAAPFKGKGGFIGSFLIDYLIFGEDLDKALAGAAGFVAGAKIGAKIGAAIGAFVGGIGAVPGAFIGGLIGGFLGPDIFKGIYSGIKRLFGFKVDKDKDPSVEGGEGVELDMGTGIESTEGEVFGMSKGGKVPGPRINRDIIPAMLTPGEFVMTKETTDRIGASFFQALNKGGMVDKGITPINKTEANSVVEKVSSLEEGAPDIINFPVAGGGGNGGADTTSDGSGGEGTNNVPNIGFNDDNIHTLYATSLYGANA